MVGVIPQNDGCEVNGVWRCQLRASSRNDHELLCRNRCGFGRLVLRSTMSTAAEFGGYRAQHPQEVSIFNRAMASGTKRFAEAVLDVCDLGRFHHVVDVGGGDGIFLAKILAVNPAIRGTLFDQPHVIRHSAAPLKSFEASDRCQSVEGNFFVSVPEGADAYLLKWILHDWDDIASIAMLWSCRRAINPTRKLLEVEYLIPPRKTGPEGKRMDLAMMVMIGGQEQTQDEFTTPFAQAGFRLISETPTATAV